MPSNVAGPLVQTAGPTEGAALRLLLHDLIRDVTGLAGTLVRPMWQPEPPPVPAITVDWCAFSIVSQTPDANAYHDQDSDTSAKIVRHEDLEVLCAWYGPNCQDYAGRLRDALDLSQNRDTLRAAGIGYVGSSGTMRVPEQINARWFDRADLTLSFRREIRRTYAVMKFLGVTGTITTDNTEPLTHTWQA